MHLREDTLNFVQLDDSDLFLPAQQCQSCGAHTLYDPTSSSTARDLHLAFDIEYDDGSFCLR